MFWCSMLHPLDRSIFLLKTAAFRQLGEYLSVQIDPGAASKDLVR